MPFLIRKIFFSENVHGKLRFALLKKALRSPDNEKEKKSRSTRKSFSASINVQIELNAPLSQVARDDRKKGEKREKKKMRRLL